MKDSIAVMIKVLGEEFDKLSNRVLNQYDLTASQFKVLKFIMLKPEFSVRQIDIENYFSMSNPTVTGIIQNLEKKGLIERVENPEDKRSKVMRVTDKTRDMEEELLQIGSELEDMFTQKLTAEEKYILKTILKKMAAG